MNSGKWLSMSLAASLSIGSVLSMPSRAVQFPDGRVAFDRPPSLLQASTTRRTVSDSSVRYYFDLSIPENAGEPLQQVVIAQRDGESFVREIQYNPEDTQAFTGSHRNRGNELSLGDVVWNRDDQSITVNFDPPVPPGTDITIRLEPERNPRRSGIYLFGVTVFPDGETPQGQFVGYGRLHFYDRGDSIFEVSNERYIHRVTPH